MHSFGIFAVYKRQDPTQRRQLSQLKTLCGYLHIMRTSLWGQKLKSASGRASLIVTSESPSIYNNYVKGSM